MLECLVKLLRFCELSEIFRKSAFLVSLCPRMPSSFPSIRTLYTKNAHLLYFSLVFGEFKGISSMCFRRGKLQCLPKKCRVKVRKKKKRKEIPKERPKRKQHVLAHIRSMVCVCEESKKRKKRKKMKILVSSAKASIEQENEKERPSREPESEVKLAFSSVQSFKFEAKQDSSKSSQLSSL